MQNFKENDPPKLYQALLKRLLEKTIQKYKKINKLTNDDVAEILLVCSPHAENPEFWVHSYKDEEELKRYICKHWVQTIAAQSNKQSLPELIKLESTYSWLIKQSRELKEIFDSFLHSTHFWKVYIEENGSWLAKKTEYTEDMTQCLDELYTHQYESFFNEIHNFLCGKELDIKVQHVKVKLEGYFFELDKMMNILTNPKDTTVKEYIGAILLKKIALEFFEKVEPISWLEGYWSPSSVASQLKDWSMKRMPDMDIYLVGQNYLDVTEISLKLPKVMKNIHHSWLDLSSNGSTESTVISYTSLFNDVRYFYTDFSQERGFSSDNDVTRSSSINIGVIDSWQLLALEKINELDDYRIPTKNKTLINIVNSLSIARSAFNETLNERRKFALSNSSIKGKDIYRDFYLTEKKLSEYALSLFGRYSKETNFTVSEEIFRLMKKFGIETKLKFLHTEIVLKWRIPLTNYYLRTGSEQCSFRASIKHPEDFVSKSILLYIFSLPTGKKDVIEKQDNERLIEIAKMNCSKSTQKVLQEIINDFNYAK